MNTPAFPSYAAPFIGREAELNRIALLLSDDKCRIVTLTGNGGIGKTRLATEAAQLYSKQFLHEVIFVPLQAVNTSDFVVTAIAETFGLQFFPNTSPKKQLLDYLSNMSCLLILDNFEHLLDASSLIEDILSATHGVKILITSRERVNLLNEWIIEVSGLSYPANEKETEIEQYEAVQLFVQRAKRIRSGFSLTNKRKPAVSRICKLVGGMPLGIELAAAWVHVLPCEEIAKEIERSLDILQSPARDIEPRHRTMRAAFEPTWKRLSKDERDVFMKLSVFRDGFGLDAANRIAGATTQTLGTLADKSLLHLADNERYSIHELLRQYGEEQLTQSGQSASIRNTHSTYYADFCSQREAGIHGHRQMEALDEIESEFENVRTAWLWAAEQRDSASIDSMLESLFLYCEMRSQFYEINELYQQALMQFETSPTLQSQQVKGRLLARLVFGAEDDTDVRRKRREQAITIAQQFESRAEVAYCWWRLGEFSIDCGNFNDALAFLGKSLTYYQEVGDRFYIAKVLNEFGIAYREMGQLETALEFEQQSLTLRRMIGDYRGIGSCLFDMGKTFYVIGRYTRAEQSLQEAATLSRKMNDRFGIRSAGEILGYLALLRGEFKLARSLSDESLKISVDLGLQRMYGASPLANLGVLASLEGDYTQGQELCLQSLEMTPSGSLRAYIHWGLAVAACGRGDDQAAKQFLVEILSVFPKPDGDTLIRSLPIAAVILTREHQFEWAAKLLGRAFTYPDNATGWLDNWMLLTSLRSELEAQLCTKEYTALWERGAGYNLEDILTLLLEQFHPQYTSGIPFPQTAQHSLVDPLSRRELEVLRLLTTRQTNREIADLLDISVGTVKTHVHRIMNKLSVTSRRQIAARASELNLV